MVLTSQIRSTPRDGHPLFTGFVKAARAYHQQQQPEEKRVAVGGA